MRALALVNRTKPLRTSERRSERLVECDCVHAVATEFRSCATEGMLRRIHLQECPRQSVRTEAWRGLEDRAVNHPQIRSHILQRYQAAETLTTRPRTRMLEPSNQYGSASSTT